MTTAHNIETKIISLLRAGDISDAEYLVSANGGINYALYHNYESAARILEALPDGAHLGSEVFLGVFCEFLNKQGRARRAKAIMDQGNFRFKRTYLSDFIELTIAIRLGENLNADKVNAWINLECRLPVDQPLSDGIYYNGMLVIMIGLNRMAEARSFGQRALESYRKAGKPYLQFYIHLHLAGLSLVAGNIKTTRRHVESAERFLDIADISYGAEREQLEIIWLAIDFEIGRFENIPARAIDLRQTLIKVENTPEIFIEICRIGAMSTYFLNGHQAATVYLRDCQIDYHRLHSDFSNALDLIMANINLLDGRAEHATQTLKDVTGQGIYSSVGMAIAETIGGKIDPVSALDQMGREAACVRRDVLAELVKASIAKSERQPATLRRHVERAMRMAVHEGLVEIFVEYREVVAKVSSKLATGSFARGHRQLERMARQVHRLVQKSYNIPERFSDLGITVQQLRVLTILQNGATNKQIARTLGLTEAAVKYHIANLFKKFDVLKRGQLIEKIDKLHNLS